MEKHIQIGKRKIGEGEPVFIVAELSANHGQSYIAAEELVYAAKDAGADAVKLQTYTADTLTLQSDKEYFRIGGGTLWDGRTLHDLYAEAYTPWDWQPKLKALAESLGLEFFASAFDETAVDFLEEMGVRVHKVASFEAVDFPLIEKMAATGKPIFLSTGMCNEEEIRDAVLVARGAGAQEIALLKCTSAYPAPPESMNLRAINRLSQGFDTVAGLSDHTLGIAVPVSAVALGAAIIEKHLTLSRAVPGPDSAFSLEPMEFKTMVDAVRTAEKALGEPRLEPTAAEKKSRVFRRSLFVVRNVSKGELFTEENVRSIRPAHGMHPRHLHEILGRKAIRDVEAGTPLDLSLVSE